MRNITAGENLKKIRKELNLKQYEIAGNEVTRNLISLIENNKTPIYHNVANIISKNINAILAKRGQDLYIQPEDILNPERYEARKTANIYIDKLENQIKKGNFNIELEYLNNIENFLNQWNFIDIKVKIYELLGDIFYNAKDFNREYYYYIKALEVSYEHPNMKKRYKLILKLVHNCIVTKKYHEAIRLCDFAISTQEDITDKYKGIFYYNLALAYYYLNDYSKALDQIVYAKFYISFDDYREMKRILMLEGICNACIENYDGALRVYEKLLKILDDNPEEICLTYVNILQIYIKRNDKGKVMEYFNKIIEVSKHIDKNSTYLPEINFSLAKSSYYLEKYDLYNEYINKALKQSYKLNNIKLFLEIICHKLDTHIYMDKFDEVVKLYKEYETEILNIETNDRFNILFRILYGILEENKIWEAKYLIKTILEKEGL